MSRPRTLIAVLGCKKNEELRALAHETWVPLAKAKGHDVEFFNGERLSCDDGYLSIMEKSIAIFKWTLAHPYDMLLKIDDDTYIRADRLRIPSIDYGGHIWPANDFGLNAFPGFANWEPRIPDYPKGTFPHDFVSGGATWLSRKAMEILAVAPANGDFAYDRWAGHTLVNAGITRTRLPNFILRPRCDVHPDEPSHYASFEVALNAEPVEMRRLHAEMKR